MSPSDAGLDLDQEWSRAGAHNIAGVSFQLAVTGRIVLDARSTVLPIAQVTPEGSEDIDLVFRDSNQGLVQVKDRAATSTFGHPDLVNALKRSHRKLVSDPTMRFILVTDARLAAGMTFGGWDVAISTAY